ncbi:MAG: CBS domain-containing protein [Rhodospirillaceae bacterium]|nr:CBS domain-containing protein [Rhodospirillaceae bacterium]
MKVEAVLRTKGSRVATTRPDVTVATVIHRLKVENIGALVVSADERTMIGLVSERDIIRGLADRGPVLLEETVDQVMSREVPTCGPQDLLTDVMIKMTRSRCRHVPVLQAGRLAGIVSIGDVLMHRLRELESETEVLRDAVYIWPHVDQGVAPRD